MICRRAELLTEFRLLCSACGGWESEKSRFLATSRSRDDNRTGAKGPAGEHVVRAAMGIRSLFTEGVHGLQANGEPRGPKAGENRNADQSDAGDEEGPGVES